MSQDDQRAKHLDDAETHLRHTSLGTTRYEPAIRCLIQHLRSPPSEPKVEPGEGEKHDAGHPHLIAGEFQSDKYPTTPRGKVPLSCKDPTAQDLLWTYAQRRRAVDAEFATDLEIALRKHGYEPPPGALELSVEEWEALEWCVKMRPGGYTTVSVEKHRLAAEAFRKLNARTQLVRNMTVGTDPAKNGRNARHCKCGHLWDSHDWSGCCFDRDECTCNEPRPSAHDEPAPPAESEQRIRELERKLVQATTAVTKAAGQIVELKAEKEALSHDLVRARDSIEALEEESLGRLHQIGDLEREKEAALSAYEGRGETIAAVTRALLGKTDAQVLECDPVYLAQMRMGEKEAAEASRAEWIATNEAAHRQAEGLLEERNAARARAEAAEARLAAWEPAIRLLIDDVENVGRSPEEALAASEATDNAVRRIPLEFRPQSQGRGE